MTKKSKFFSLLNIIRCHKLIGISIALWLLVMVITGILLNHSNDLSLDKTPIKNKTILKAYGVKPPANSFSFQLEGGISIHQFGEHLYFNQTKIKGIASINDKVLVAADNRTIFVYWSPSNVAILSKKGELIEFNDIFSIENASAIGVDTEQQFYLKTKDGVYSGNSDDLEFDKSATPKKEIKWQASKELSAEMKAYFSDQQTYKGFTWERLLLDIHNGNIFGGLNKILLDLLSLFFLVLIFSGIYIWYKKLK